MGTPDQVTIQIASLSPTTQQFCIFYEKPTISGVASGAKTHVCICAIAPFIQTGGSAIFTLDSKYYAVASITSYPPVDLASSTRQIQPKAVVIGSSSSRKDATLVNLTTQHGYPVWMHTVDSIVAPNGFAIRTDDSFEVPNRKYLHVGVGVEDPGGGSGKVATALTLAEPSKTYRFTLSSAIYVCTGSYEQGQIVDVEQLGGAYKIHLPGDQDEDLVKLKYTKFGKFEPDY